MVRQKHLLIPSRNIDHQRILKINRTTGHTPPRVLFLGAPFFRWLYPCKKSKILFGSFHRYCWSKNPAIWLGKRRKWPHPMVVSGMLTFLDDYFHEKTRYQLNLSKETGNHRILQFDWTRNLNGHAQNGQLKLDATFPDIFPKISLDFFQRYWW